MFRFSENLRPIVKQTAEAIVWANNQRNQLACQDGVYGHFAKALDGLVAHECGDDVLEKISHSRYGWNWGGNKDPLADVEAVIQDAIDEIEMERHEADVADRQASEKYGF